MGRVPSKVLDAISGHEGDYSHKALHLRFQLEIEWADLETVARTATFFQTEHDEQGTAVDGRKHKMIGRDTHGRLIYTAGKIMRGFDEEVYWYVITIERAE